MTEVRSFHWTSTNDILFVTNQGLEFYQVRGRRKSSQKLAKRRTLVSFSTPSLPLETNGNRKTGFNVPLAVGNLLQKRVHVLPALLNVVGHLRDNRSLDRWKVPWVVRESYCVQVCFTSKSKVDIFPALSWTAGGAHVVGEQSLRVKTQVRRGGINCCLIERISQCLRPLCTAGSSEDAERQAWRRWSERTTAAVVASARLVRLSRGRSLYRWCAGQGKQVFDSASIANRDKYHPLFGELLHYLLFFLRIRLGTCSPHPFAT